MLVAQEIAKKLIESKRAGIWCFNFHQISMKYDPLFHNRGTFTSLSLFSKYIRYIRNRFNLISVSKAFEMLDNKSVNDRYACITFDDGDSSIEDIIPYLIENNIPASFFLNTAYIDDKKIDPFRVANYLVNANLENINITKSQICGWVKILRHSRKLDEYNYAKNKLLNLNYLMPDEHHSFYVRSRFLFDIKNDLINFGLHGYEHDRFILLSRDEQKTSLIKNIEFVGKLHGYKPLFAIPFGRPRDWNNDTINVCNDLELRYLFANGGFNKGDCPGLKRIPADNRNLLFDMRIGYYQ